MQIGYNLCLLSLSSHVNIDCHCDRTRVSHQPTRSEQGWRVQHSTRHMVDHCIAYHTTTLRSPLRKPDCIQNVVCALQVLLGADNPNISHIFRMFHPISTNGIALRLYNHHICSCAQSLMTYGSRPYTGLREAYTSRTECGMI